jgi:deazaflavin-dependent oxidoreductase (nitroreductase family)
MKLSYRHLRARALKVLFDTHRVVYEASDGRLGAHLGLPMLLLTVTGRKSGEPRTTALVYFKDGDRYVVVGSDGGARRDPQWWKNLQVESSGKMRVGRRQADVDTHLAQGDERVRLWAMGQDINPMWERYQRTTKRELPVVVLTPH